MNARLKCSHKHRLIMETTSFDSRPSRPWNTPWNRPWNIRKTEHARRKPEGGFQFIPALALMRTWWAYKQGIIRLLDLRVWLAIHETVARRCKGSKNLFFRHTKEEIQLLVGGAKIASIQTAIRRLSNAGLLEWSERSIRFPVVTADTQDDGEAEWREMVELVTNHRRKVPVPRRTLRFIAGMTRPVTIATVLGHLLRCMYYRDGHCEPTGRCKASWVAGVFRVDVRNVKAARRNLNQLQWLVIDRSRQMAMNRWGAGIRLNLSWQASTRERDDELPPPTDPSIEDSPPLKKDWELSSRKKNQNPRISSRPGVSASPSLGHVRLEDLLDSRCLDRLFIQAQERSLVGRGDGHRLNFHAAAAHAIRVGKQNPAGLFVAVVQRRLWAYISAADEDMARRRLARDKGCSDCKPAGITVTSEPTTVGVVLTRLLPQLPQGCLRSG